MKRHLLDRVRRDDDGSPIVSDGSATAAASATPLAAAFTNEVRQHHQQQQQHDNGYQNQQLLLQQPSQRPPLHHETLPFMLQGTNGIIPISGQKRFYNMAAPVPDQQQHPQRTFNDNLLSASPYQPQAKRAHTTAIPPTTNILNASNMSALPPSSANASVFHGGLFDACSGNATRGGGGLFSGCFNSFSSTPNTSNTNGNGNASVPIPLEGTNQNGSIGSMMMNFLMQQQKHQENQQQQQKLRTVEDCLSDEMKRLTISEQNEVAKDIQESMGGAAAGSIPPPILSDSSVDDRLARVTSPTNLADEEQESPERLEHLLQEMDAEIAKLRKQKEWYEKAAFLSPWYVKDRNFRLLFLRADRYHPKKAASRIALHFKIKAKLFGDEKLGTANLHLLAKPITWDDLDEETQRCHLSGHATFLRGARDRGRRGIFCCNYTLWSAQFSSFAYLRTYWYNIMSMYYDDIGTQKRGMVGVVFSIGKSVRQVISIGQVITQGHFDSCMPVRGAAIYLCLDPSMAVGGHSTPAPPPKNSGGKESSVVPMVSYFTTLFQQRISQALRLRVRTFFGSFLECYYQLTVAGIPVGNLPYTSNGELDNVVLTKLISRSKACEDRFLENDRQERIQEQLKLQVMQAEVDEETVGGKSAKKTDKEAVTKIVTGAPLIVNPCNFDVLLGRGRPYQNFSGNVQLFEHIESCKDVHDAFEKQRREKTDLSRKIVRRVQANGGRFLKRAGPGWMEVDDDQARIKVAMGFRNLARNKRKDKDDS